MAQQGSYSGDSEEVWNELREETGFSSYIDYLLSSGQDPYVPLFKVNACSIANVWRTKGSELETTRHDFTEPESRSTATKILEALRHPPPGVSLRVVLWWCSEMTEDDGTTSNSNIGEICGLGLKVSPQFFTRCKSEAIEYSTIHGLWYILFYLPVLSSRYTRL